MFVKSGKGPPYQQLENSIIVSLKKKVQHLEVVSPNQNLLAIANTINPDLVLVFDGWSLPVDQVRKLKSKGIRTTIWLTDDPYYTDLTQV
ncbi:spore maturation protein cgeB, partial [Bacillus pseudomycoides]